MTNNKQQTAVKLYTEKQVRDAIKKRFTARYTKENVKYYLNTDQVIEELTPIELPSDEEVCERAFQQWGDYSKTSHQNAYLEGAKWMRDKIQGGEQ